LAVQLAAPAAGVDRPTLLVTSPGEGEAVHRLYRPSGDAGWSNPDLALPEHADPVVLRVAGQLVVVHRDPKTDSFAARARAIRGDRPTLIGTLTSDSEMEVSQWAAVPLGESLGLLLAEAGLTETLRMATEGRGQPDAVPGPAVLRIDLRGAAVRPPLTLGVAPTRSRSQQADYIILLTVVITSTVLLFAFWRRDPLAQELKLPEDAALADPLRRGLAGLIDLAPGLLVGTLGFGLSLPQLYDLWPGRGLGATFTMMLPGLAAVAVVVGHTLLLELLTGRSLGKLLTGLRVVDLSGADPRAWQVLVRCGLKAFDLVAYLLLILPLINPLRQRLGDMVARTVVVVRKPPPADDAPDAGVGRE
jgi:uncharacterized RDD family membrane protein YckC